MEREIAGTDEQIDELVYELYGIPDAKRTIIDGSYFNRRYALW